MEFEDKAKEGDWRTLVKLFARVSSTEEMDQLLHLFLTINERDYLVDRYRIIKALLTSDLTQRDIAEQMEVSIAKITAGSNELKRTSPALKQLFAEFIEQEENTEPATEDTESTEEGI